MKIGTDLRFISIMGNWWITAFVLIVGVSLCHSKWWQSAVIYQIYPRSFMDSNGDGVGDLNGITQRMEHIKDAGCDALWLSPIYKSPMYDFGYDIADFKEIHWEYGTMADFEALVKKAKQLGLRVVLDFVPNHSSNESDWFNHSVNRTGNYTDYFVWEDGIPDPENASILNPPNNWVSVFRKSAWEYNPIRRQFFLHQFVIGQPDLNYRNPNVVEEMKNVLRFWLRKGVDGFRVDAVPFLFETEKVNGKFPDEPRTYIYGAGPDDFNYLQHIYTQDQEPTYDMIYQWRAVLDEFEKEDGIDRVMLAEAYTDVKNVMRYFGDGTRDGANLPFNFEFLSNININSDARDMKFYIDKWETYKPIGRTSNWVNGNHDQKRMASRFGIDRADSMNMLAMLLPGTTLTYQGEELAMTDGYVSWEDTKDPAACNTDDPINYNDFSRDPARTPFHWDDTTNAGFSTAAKTWLPMASNYREVNVKAQLSAERSHLKFYKDLTALKKTNVLKEGDFETKALSESILVIARYLNNERVVGVINLSNRYQNVTLSSFHNLPRTMTVYSSSLRSTLTKGMIVGTADFMAAPYAAIVLKSGAWIVKTTGILQMIAVAFAVLRQI